MFEYLKDRLKEPSTWRGFVMLFTAMGAQISPAQTDAIVTAGIALVGLIGIFSPDKPKL